MERLQYISQDINGKTHLQNIEEACEAGVRWVQLRVKGKSKEEVEDLALKAREICNRFEAIFIMNDYVEIAKSVGADGVHLGKTDTAVAEARRMLGGNAIVGATANTLEDIKRLSAEDINYFGLGPFRFTETKDNLSPIVGLVGFEKVVKGCLLHGISIPIIAIGGIQPEDVTDILNTGVFGIAVSSGVNRSNQKEETIGKYYKYLNSKKIN